jgi:hypothetical protein
MENPSSIPTISMDRYKRERKVSSKKPPHHHLCGNGKIAQDTELKRCLLLFPKPQNNLQSTFTQKECYNFSRTKLRLFEPCFLELSLLALCITMKKHKTDIQVVLLHL